MRRMAVVLGVATLAGLPPTADAHPHAFIDASLTVIFDEARRLTGVHEEWAFDNDFGDSLRLQADANRDEKLDDAELRSLADLIARTLAPYGFYTQVVAGGERVGLGAPDDLAARVEDYRVRVGFTLPIAEPIAVDAAGIDVYDGELNFAVSWVSPPLEAVNLPAGCRLVRRDRIADDPAARALVSATGTGAALTPDAAEGYPVRAVLACP